MSASSFAGAAIVETTYFEKPNIRVTDQQIITKKDSVLIRDVSAVQLKTSTTASVFGFVMLVVCALFAYGASQTGHAGLMVLAVVLGLFFVGAIFSGRNVVVTTRGGAQVEVASGLIGEMRPIKDAISRAMKDRDAG
jgi:hypothetical protein